MNSPDSVMLDVRDRLARIEVKIDNTHEKLRDHDERITHNRNDIESLKTEMTTYKAKIATYGKVGSLIALCAATVAWFIDHAGMVATVVTSVPR